MRKYTCVQKHEGLPDGFCDDCFKKQLKIDRLEEEVKRLKSQLKYREKKNQEPFGLSTPSSKITIKKSTTEENKKKRGGAKIGHKGYGRNIFNEEEANEIADLEVEETGCPECGGELEEKEIDDRYIIDSILLEAKKILYKCHTKKCKQCKTEIGRKPLVLPRYKYGNNLISETLILHYLEGLPFNRIGEIWGKDVSTSALQNIAHELAGKFEPLMEMLQEEYRQAPVKHADETSWRTDGDNGYAWLFNTPDLSVFRFEDNRSQQVPASVLGSESVPGTLVVDRYCGYNKVPCKIQYCYEHLKRDLQALRDKFPKDKEVKKFVAALLPHIKAAIKLHSKNINDSAYYKQASELKKKILECVNASASHLAIQAYQNIFRDNKHRLFHWVEDRRVPSHNNRAERELRPTVIARKVSFGSQSEKGARTRSVLMSVLHSVSKRLTDQTVKQWLVHCLNTLAINPDYDIRLLMPKFH